MHIIAELSVGFGSICFLTGRGFQLHQYNWQTIEKQNHIRALIAVFNESPLIGDNKGVFVNIYIINKIDKTGVFLALYKIAYYNAVLDIVHKNGVFLNHFGIFKIFQFK